MKFVLSTLFFSLLLCSCSEEDILREEQKEIDCYNLRYLSSDFENLPKIDFDLDFFTKSKIEDIREKFGFNYCDGIYSFISDFENFKDIKVDILYSRIGYCLSGVILSNWDIYEISINWRSQLAIEGRYILDTDLLKNDFKNYYLKNYDRFHLVMFGFDPNAEGVNDKINIVLGEVIKGYRLAVQEISFQKYSKEICELTTEEYLEFKKIVPFKIGFAPNFIKNIPNNISTLPSIN